MKSLVHFGLFFTILTQVCDTEAVQQRFIAEPESVSVKEGQNVTLSCSVDNKMGVLQWTKGGVATYLGINDKSFCSFENKIRLHHSIPFEILYQSCSLLLVVLISILTIFIQFCKFNKCKF